MIHFLNGRAMLHKENTSPKSLITNTFRLDSDLYASDKQNFVLEILEALKKELDKLL